MGLGLVVVDVEDEGPQHGAPCGECEEGDEDVCTHGSRGLMFDSAQR